MKGPVGDTTQLYWDKREEAICSNYRDLYEQGRMLDVTITAGGKTLKAHKLILAAASPFFMNMFSSGQDSRTEVCLVGASSSDLVALIDFVYRGKVNIPNSEVASFMRLGTELGLRFNMGSAVLPTPVEPYCGAAAGTSMTMITPGQQLFVQVAQAAVPPPVPAKIPKKQIDIYAHPSPSRIKACSIPFPDVPIGIPLTAFKLQYKGFTDFWFQPESHLRILIKVEDEIKKVIDSAKTLRKPKVGDLCLAPYKPKNEEIGEADSEEEGEIEDERYRAQVLGIKGEEASLFYFDLGSKGKISKYALQEMPESLKKYERAAAHGQWIMAYSEDMSEDDKNKEFSLFIEKGGNMTIIKKITDGQYLFDIGTEARSLFADFLIHPETVQRPAVEEGRGGSSIGGDVKIRSNIDQVLSPEKVSMEEVVDGAIGGEIPKQQINQEVQGHATPSLKSNKTEVMVVPPPAPAPSAARAAAAQPSHELKWMFADCPMTDKIEPGAKVLVPFIWSPSKMMVYASDDEHDLKEMHALINRYVKGQPMKFVNRAPEKGEIVLAPYENEFFRGRVAKLSEPKKKCKVEFLDYGDTLTCAFKDLIIPSGEIMEYPIFGRVIALEGCNDYPEDYKITCELHDEITTKLLVIYPEDDQENLVKLEFADRLKGPSVNELVHRDINNTPAPRSSIPAPIR